nr:MAG TPA: hypothetical protein [Caudoviricetes sp.]
MLRTRMRISARAWKTKDNRRTTMGTCPRCGAEGNEPQQQHPGRVES